MKLEDMTLDVEQHIEIKGSPDKVFAAVLHRFGKGNIGPDGQSLQLELEPKAGGRWYRDRGNGVGHLWGFVQAIKPPTLLEISGPLFMSYPANNHVEIKVENAGDSSKVILRHRAIGMIDPRHRENVGKGWKQMLEGVKKDAE
jgi:hypothetical protein